MVAWQVVEWALKEPWRAAVAAAAAVGLLLWLKERLTCAEPFGRHAFKQGRLEAGSVKRMQLDRLRAERGHFPKPFPDGWYKFCDSSELQCGQVVTVAALGREFVAFRGEDGKAGVCDAFCPHLGTHLGHGGRVHGNKLVCPYHLWEFNAEGKCVGIPYCSEKPTSKRVDLPSWTTYESAELGVVFFWFSADGEKEPRWPLSEALSQVEGLIKFDGMRRVYADRWSDMLMHVFEPSQNSADPIHFASIHQRYVHAAHRCPS